MQPEWDISVGRGRGALSHRVGSALLKHIVLFAVMDLSLSLLSLYLSVCAHYLLW